MTAIRTTQPQQLASTGLSLSRLADGRARAAVPAAFTTFLLLLSAAAELAAAAAAGAAAAAAAAFACRLATASRAACAAEVAEPFLLASTANLRAAAFCCAAVRLAGGIVGPGRLPANPFRR